MPNTLNKANTIVGKAISVFEQAIEKVDKANEILREGIRNDLSEIEIKEIKQDELKARILELEGEKLEKLVQIEKNNSLIDQLKTFIQS